MSLLRERFREQMRDEIKAVACRQLAGGGAAAISLNAIARELGVSGPALYRYFPRRDALLVALVADAYQELGEAVAGAGDLATFADRYRRWALDQPQRYRLMFAPPLSPDGALRPDALAHAHALMHELVALPDLPVLVPDTRLRDQLRQWSSQRTGEIAPERALGAIEIWAALHGLVSLELDDNFRSMGLDGAAVFAQTVVALSQRQGAPRRSRGNNRNFSPTDRS